MERISNMRIHPEATIGFQPIRGDSDPLSIVNPSVLNATIGRNLINAQRSGDTSCAERERGVVARTIPSPHTSSHDFIRLDCRLLIPTKATGISGRNM